MRCPNGAEMSHDELSEVVDSFVRTAEANGLTGVRTQLDHPQRSNPQPGVAMGIGLFLRDGTDLPCLAVATDELGNWSVVTLAGYVRQYLATEVW